MKWKLPASVSAGDQARLAITHTLPNELGEQLLHVTLKDGAGKRIERKVIRARGNGQLEIQFDVPRRVENTVSFALFIGQNFAGKLQSLKSKPVAVK